MTKVWPPSYEDYTPSAQYAEFSAHTEDLHSFSISESGFKWQNMKDVWLRDDEEYVDENIRSETKRPPTNISSTDESQFFDVLYGHDSMNSHFEWAMLCLSGEIKELQKLRGVSKKSKPKKQKPKRKKTKTGKAKKASSAKSKSKKRPMNSKQGPSKVKKRPCPCKKVPGWNGVFARTSQDGTKKYFILISLRGKKTYDGSYETEEDCALAYDDLIVRERGLQNVLDRLNFPERYGLAKEVEEFDNAKDFVMKADSAEFLLK